MTLDQPRKWHGKYVVVRFWDRDTLRGQNGGNFVAPVALLGGRDKRLIAEISVNRHGRASHTGSQAVLIRLDTNGLVRDKKGPGCVGGVKLA